MEHWEGACIHCSETITNPLCAGCISKELEQWLLEKSEDLVEEMRQTTRALELDASPGHTCVVCGTHMNLCPYCYTEYVFVWLRDNYPELVPEFIDFFNFDLGHQGYEKEAEALC